MWQALQHASNWSRLFTSDCWATQRASCEHARVERWADVESGRDVFVLTLARAEEWSDATPWSSEGFGLLVLTEHVIDVGPLAAKAVARGVAVVCSWGPGCSMIEDAFDEAIVDAHPSETDNDVVLTTSHEGESLEEAIEFFLDVILPSKDRAASCHAWCIVAFCEDLQKRVTRAMERRGANRV